MSGLKNISLPRTPTLALITRPDTIYAVQQAFTRTKRIFMVDTVTLEYIDGLVNEPDVLLTLTPPPASIETLQRPMGFIQGPPTVIKPKKPKASEADAKLYFYYPSTDQLSGYDQKSGITYLVLRVWHDAEVEKWRRRAQRVAKEMAVLNGGEPAVMFSITSSIIPNDPNAPRRMILDPHGNDAEYSVNAVSPFLLPSRKVSKWLEDE